VASGGMTLRELFSRIRYQRVFWEDSLRLEMQW
jgi:hypothetical protein